MKKILFLHIKMISSLSHTYICTFQTAFSTLFP